MKVCTKCKREKQLDLFSKHNTKSQGRASWCRGSMSITITFDRATTLRAVDGGQARTAASKHRKDAWGLVNDDEVLDARRQTVGTLGEFAVMRMFGQELTVSVNTFKLPDVVVNGWGLQIKASEYAKNLTIRSDSKDFEPYILCRVQMPPCDPREWATCDQPNISSTVEILGWIFPYIARLWADLEPSLYRDPGNRNSPAIFIPADWLNSMDSLMALTETNVSEYNLV